MPFQLRVTETPTLNRLLELEQIVLVDKTGPAVPLGPAQGAVCLVGEFLKGPFGPREATSTADLTSTWGGVSNLLSQAADGTQDGSGIRYEGNGAVALLGKQFLRLIIQRVNTDMTTTDGGASKCFVEFDVDITTADEDPLDATITGRDIVIPAGTRFADQALATATKIVALSQDVLIPRGSTITANQISISNNLVQNSDGLLTLDPTATENVVGASAFFVLGTSATAGGADLIDTPIDTVLPNVTSTIAAAGVSTIDAAGAASDAFAAGTAAAVLEDKIESLYAAAIDKTRPSASPQEDITVIWSARRGETASTIRTPLVNNAINSSEEGRGRVALVNGPRVGTATGDAASTSAAKTEVQTTTPTESPGRQDRKIIGFPYVKVFSSTLNKNVDVAADGFMASTLSNFPEEKNPGARNDFIQSIQDFEQAFQDTPMSKQDYINFKAKGVAALRRDRAVGWQFQSGVTSVDPVVDQTRAPIKRRRMADFIQDGLAAIGASYNKEPATTERIDSLVGDIDTFLSNLLSPQNPALQRIEDFSIDEVSGNTPQLQALGIFTVIVKVRLLASLDTLVFETQIGETVEVNQTT